MRPYLCRHFGNSRLLLVAEAPKALYAAKTTFLAGACQLHTEWGSRLNFVGLASPAEILEQVDVHCW